VCAQSLQPCLRLFSLNSETKLFSPVFRLSVTLWTGGRQAWDSPGKKPGVGSHPLPDPGIQLAALLCLLHWDRGFFTTCATESRSQWVEGGGGDVFLRPYQRPGPHPNWT